MGPFSVQRNGYVVKVCRWSQAVLVTVETPDGEASWMAQVAYVSGRVKVLPQRAVDWPLDVLSTLVSTLEEPRLRRFVRQAAWASDNVRVIDGGAS